MNDSINSTVTVGGYLQANQNYVACNKQKMTLQ
jgi:hypothetical protein